MVIPVVIPRDLLLQQDDYNLTSRKSDGFFHEDKKKKMMKTLGSYDGIILDLRTLGSV